MFGRDTFTLSKPREIKTVAKSFSETIKKVPGQAVKPAYKPDEQTAIAVRQAISPIRSNPVVARQEISADEIEITMRKGNLKLEVVKPFARNFLKQVNKLEELKEHPIPEGKGSIIFSYSDSKGRWGKLENSGEKIRVNCIKKQHTEYTEDQIDIYSLNEFTVQPNGIFFQVKGWGNQKELSIVNALKNSLAKMPANGTQDGKIIFNYALLSMNALLDGGFECKVKVTPGKLIK
jgi:hypothetical protein